MEYQTTLSLETKSDSQGESIYLQFTFDGSEWR